ncbi:MAG: hypothetical protein ACRD3W_24855, partial [Terriglobales bacterium]
PSRPAVRESRDTKESSMSSLRGDVSTARRAGDSTGQGIQSFKVSDLRKMDEQKAHAESTTRLWITIIVLGVALFVVVALLLIKMFGGSH